MASKKLYIRGDHESDLKPSIIFKNYTLNETLTLYDVVPENISVKPSSPLYSTFDIAGRSSVSSGYTGGDTRTITFTLNLHRDLFGDSEKEASDKFLSILNFFDALNYPAYTTSGVVPPRCRCRVISTQSIKGYAQVSYELKKPIDRYGRFMVADVSVTMTEVVNTSWDAREIRSGYVSKKEVPESR